MYVLLILETRGSRVPAISSLDQCRHSDCSYTDLVSCHFSLFMNAYVGLNNTNICPRMRPTSGT
jgi:hypothetical protein